MTIPHSKPTIDQEDVKAVSEILRTGRIAQGDKVNEFEEAIASLIGVKYGVAVSSGTSALHVALLGLGVKPEDEVIMPSYVCSSPYFATLHARAVPKIVDIEPSGFNISSLSIRNQLSPKAKAIIVPHMFGTPAEIDELREIGIPIIEDCAQSLGAEYKGCPVGSFGHLSTYSFYATKMITAGEGGMVLTNDKEYYRRIIAIRDYDKKPLTPTKYNYKMTDFQAALGLSQLKKLKCFIERRKQIASLYTKEFWKYDVDLPKVSPYMKSVFYRYVIMVDNIVHVQKKLKKRGVTCERPIFQPLHKNWHLTNCPNSDIAHDHALSVPIYPALSNENVEHIMKAFADTFADAHADSMLSSTQHES